MVCIRKTATNCAVNREEVFETAVDLRQRNSETFICQLHNAEALKASMVRVRASPDESTMVPSSASTVTIVSCLENIQVRTSVETAASVHCSFHVDAILSQVDSHHLTSLGRIRTHT